MVFKNYIFAGGGTGGHIYPAIAIAERIVAKQKDANIFFYCSKRAIDRDILTNSGYEFKQLPAFGLSLRPDRLFKFLAGLVKSTKIVRGDMADDSENVKFNPQETAVISCGGFVCAPVVWAAQKLNVPVFMLNVDMTPGKANKYLARFSKTILVQFKDTIKLFGKNSAKVVVSGCPLRAGFADTINRKDFLDGIGLDSNKKTLLVTGASSGSANINNTIALLLDKLAVFSDSWQVLHLTGNVHYEAMRNIYASARMDFKVLAYYEDMPKLLKSADLLIGRAGAVSVAEFLVASLPSICMPYPYHRDQHQKLNAMELVDAGCSVLVEDSCDAQTNATALWPVLKDLMSDDDKLSDMSKACENIAKTDAADFIADYIIND